MGNEDRSGRGSDLDVLHSFWRAQTHIGLVLWGFGSIGLAVYLAATPSGPHRPALSVLTGIGLFSSLVVFWWGGLRMVNTRWRTLFFCGWVVFTIATLSVGVGLDGGVTSPVVYLLALPVLLAGLALPPVAVAALSVMAITSYIGLALGTPEAAAPEAVVGMGLAMACLLATTGAWNRHVQDQRLYELATHDGLTQCLTYRAFWDRLDAEVARAVRYDRPLSIVMADVDRLKQLNDTSGHAAGDAALAAVGGVLLEGARDVDLVGRLGGDEFAVLLPETDDGQLPAVLARLRAGLQAGPPAGPPAEPPARRPTGPPPVSVSFGAASWRGAADTAADLVARADQALYQAKRARMGC